MKKTARLDRDSSTASRDCDVVASKSFWERNLRNLIFVELEFVDSKNFSASRRPRGYEHNFHGVDDECGKEQDVGVVKAAYVVLSCLRASNSGGADL